MRLLLPLAVLWIATPTSAQGLKQVRDWVGACDNTRHCTAIGLAPEDAETDAMLHFERAGAADARVAKLTLRVDHPLPRGASWSLMDEQQRTLLTLTDFHLVDVDGGERRDVIFESPAEIDSLLGALRAASVLTLVGENGPVGTVSLSGASAVLLWIDEQQRRLGTTTAFVRRGAALPGSIPAPPAAPRAPLPVAAGIALGPMDARAIGERLRSRLDDDECEALDVDVALSDEAWQLVDGRALVQLVCFVGAYNVGSRWYLLDAADRPEPLALPVPGESGRLIRETDLINASFDAERGRLLSFGKGRGIGDCGAAGEWGWTGTEFVLVSYTSLPLCRGVWPEFWPVLWRSAE